MPVVNPQEWPTVTTQRQPDDELVQVVLDAARGVSVKMDKQAAIRRGLYTEPAPRPVRKRSRPASDKRRRSKGDK